jgi:hypothetical protein
MYMRNRYYDPASGRFTQEDPIGIAGGLNVYGFASGDPVSYTDPYGLKPEAENDAKTNKKDACPPLCDHPDPAKDHFIRTKDPKVAAAATGVILLATGAGIVIESAEALLVWAGVRAAPLAGGTGAAAGGTTLLIRFGNSANQVYHAFRHVVDAP